MDIQKVITSTIIVLLLSFNSFAQDKAKEGRLLIAKEFALDFKKGLSDDAILSKYAVERSHTASDSLKQFTKEWMDYFRKSYKDMNENDVVVLKYLEHPEEFYVYQDQTKPTMNFKLVTPERKETDVNLNDLYFVKVNPKGRGGQLILFNDENKMISFIGWTVGFNTGLVQF